MSALSWPAPAKNGLGWPDSSAWTWAPIAVGPGPSYAPVGLVASGSTRRRLDGGGLLGQLRAVADANPAIGPEAAALVAAGGSGLADAYRALDSAVDNYLRGDPADAGSTLDRIAAAASVFRAIAQAADEIGLLIEDDL